MRANYGFEDGTGNYFITIDTDKCVQCETHDCIDVCPQHVYLIDEDDWGDDVLIVSSEKVHKLRECCVSCKTGTTSETAPCIGACKYNAIVHSW